MTQDTFRFTLLKEFGHMGFRPPPSVDQVSDPGCLRQVLSPGLDSDEGVSWSRSDPPPGVYRLSTEICGLTWGFGAP